MFLLSLCVPFVVGVCVERERERERENGSERERGVVLKIDRYID